VHYDMYVKTPTTPTDAQFYNLYILSIISCYIFRHYRHRQGAHTNISLKHTTITVWCYFNEILVWGCWRWR